MKKKKIKLLSRGEPVVAMGGGSCGHVSNKLDCPSLETSTPPFKERSGRDDDIGPLKPF